MGRCLIVANQTLGADRLEVAFQERIRRGDDRFYVLVPMTVPKHETTAWMDGFPVPETMTAAQIDEARRVMEEGERARADELAEARRRAEERLDMMIETIRAAGGDADGRVGDTDPAVAVRDLLDDHRFDEIIVSTLPARISRWLRMDLPSRIERMTDVPVVTLEADEHGH